MGRRLIAPLAAMLALAGAVSADAAPTWQPAETLEIVRGVPNPSVAINGWGNATVAYSKSDTLLPSTGVVFGTRPPGGNFEVQAPRPAGQSDAQIATAPNGATAVAADDRGRIFVTLYASPGPAGGGGNGPTDSNPVAIDTGGMAVEGLQVGIDATGRATVVWSSPRISTYLETPARTFVATVAPPRTVVSVHPLGGPGHCTPRLDVNLRGDVVVARDCIEQPDHFFYKPAGGTFGGAELPFADDAVDPEDSRTGAALDGAGNVYAFQAIYDFHDKVGVTDDRVLYAIRPPAGPFGSPQQFGPEGITSYGFDMEAQEDGDVVAVWSGGYAFRQPVTGSWSVTRLAIGSYMDLVTSPNGPALVSWRVSGGESFDVRQVVAARIAPGTEPSISRLGIAGYIEPGVGQTPFAINDAGQAVGAWEQRCSKDGASAVVAVALDESSAERRPPCQDRRAPKVIVVRKRAVLQGRTLRLRVACDETCHLTASARVLRAGKPKPIATAKTHRERRLGARRGGWVSMRLTAAAVRRIARADRVGRRVTVRYGISVRDEYGTGRKWRFRVPLR